MRSNKQKQPPSTQQLSQYQQFAEQMVRAGGTLAHHAFLNQNSETQLKSDSSFVTKTDTEIESLYRSKIKEAYPNHMVYGEEYGGTLDSQQPTWIIDPLDGTTNFSHQIPLFCSMVSLMIDQVIVCTAMYSPIQDMLFSTRLGAGAEMNHQPLPALSVEKRLDRATLLLDSGKSEDARATAFGLLAHSGATFRSFRKYGCMVAPLLYAARSKLDVAIIYGVDLYDVAGLSLFFREAGYVVLGSGGHEWKHSANTDLTITTPTLKKQVQLLLDQKQTITS